MCNLAVAKICIVLFVCLVCVNSEVTTENGGYSVLVSFSQNVRPEDGINLISMMKMTLKDASSLLYNAIGRQFTKVTLRIPVSWIKLDLNITISDSGSIKNAKADFLIDSTNDVIFGKFPFAQQYGGCGIPGHQIIIPTAFFTDANKFPKGTILAREWLKYRYGVFDENGYVEDSLYPLYYVLPGSDPNNVTITECTNVPVRYNFKDRSGTLCSDNGQPLIKRLNSKECSLMPDKESLENVTSSLMYFQQDITDMQHICGKDPDDRHNALSPNKHNAMCSGQSVWDIVKMAEDFQGEIASKDYGNIEYDYVIETKPKVIVAWENTKNVNRIKGAVILKSIKRFIYDLPSGSKFNGFPFWSSLSDEKNYTLIELNNLSDKNNIMANIKADFEEIENGNINLAIAKALDILSSDGSNPELEETIIVITKSSEGTVDKSLLERLQKSKACVMLLYLSEGVVSDEIKNYVSELPCGSLTDISFADSDHDMFNKLFSALETVLPATVEDKITETVATASLTQESPITFQVDDSIETVTIWVFTGREAMNFELKFNAMKRKLNELTTTPDTLALTYSPTESGSIEFSYRHLSEPLLTQVRVTSKAGKYFKGHVFIQDTSEKSSPDQMPIIIYAMIRYGAYPVQNALVSATVERPNKESIAFEMFDDGRGDPDITQNDGTYSRYFTQFSEKGEYTVTVTVECGDLASYGVDRNAGYQTCCGSVLNTVNSKVPVSSKEFKATFTAKSGRPDDGYKPSRILDLKIDDVTDDKIVLKWSAPGEEGDSGTVQSYEIKRFPSHEEATNDQNGTILDIAIVPTERGGTQTLELKLSDFEETGRYYITIAAKNSKQISDTSNILEIFIPDKETTTTPKDRETDETKTDDAKTGGISKTTALIIGLVIGLAVLIILIYLIVYFLVIKPKRKEEMKENPVYHTTKRDENNVLNPINFISADTLLRHHSEKTRAKMQNQEPPIFKEEDFEGRNSPPTPESEDNNNAQQPESSYKTVNNEEALPPKSPKKTTYV